MVRSRKCFPPFVRAHFDPHRLQGNFYIFFVILTDSLEDSSLGFGSGIKILNIVLNYVYLGLLIMCFLLSLGNRPQGSKFAFTFAIIGFALITVYMTVRYRSV